MPPRKLHPLVNEALFVGLRAGARAAARALDSLLSDTAKGLGIAEEKIAATRATIKRKVRDSGVQVDDGEEEEWER
jgi:hypothetical protein